MNRGAETGRVLFLYVPAGAGGLLEEEQRTQGTTRSDREAAELRRHAGGRSSEIIRSNDRNQV